MINYFLCFNLKASIKIRAEETRPRPVTISSNKSDITSNA